jgi:hypothetical protein
VDDQRVVGGAAFGGKNGGHRRVVVGVGRQSVNRFGWQANQTTIPYGSGSSSY